MTFTSPMRALRIRPAAPWLWLGALLLVLAVTRLAGLGVRLPHHDEMVHMRIAGTLATEGLYRADPPYHGPLLYHLEAGVFAVAGSGLWQARLVPALAAIAASFALVLLAWRESGRRAAIAVALIVTLSPSWLFYGRFNGHDSLILLASVLVAWGRWQWMHGSARAAAWLVVPVLALAWSAKLNTLFIAGAIACWPLVWWSVGGRAPVWALRARPARPWSMLLWPAVAAALLMAALFATTYQALLGDQSPASALTTTLRAASIDPVVYWTRLHGEQRLGGPFHYYGLLLTLYEPLLVIGALVALVQAWRHRQRSIARALLWLAAGTLAAVALTPLSQWVRDVLHLRPVHLTVVPLLLAALWTYARHCAASGDDAGAWWAWLAAAQTVLYGYAGEKVPWLAVHVALPWMMIAGRGLALWWDGPAGTGPRTLPLAVTFVAAALTAHGAVAVTTWNRTNVAEPLLQLEYDPLAHATLARVGKLCPSLDVTPCLVTTVDARWPAQWYLGAPLDRVATGFDRDLRWVPFVFTPARRAESDVEPPSLEASHDAYAMRFAVWGSWTTWAYAPSPKALGAFWLWRRSLGLRVGVPYRLWVRRDLTGTWNETP